MDQTLITRIVEAALLAAPQPLTVAQLRGLFTVDEPAPDGAIEQALADLRAAGQSRGVELAETASGHRFQVRADVHPWVARLWTERQARYTRATLETLAIIAYRQPITRGEIEQVRGVAVSSNIIKALEEREWIRSVGHRDVPGRPELLGTTRAFLDYFGLKRLDQLPPLSELKDFGELDPQLSFEDPDAREPGPIAVGVRGDAPQDGGDADAEAMAEGDEVDAAGDPGRGAEADVAAADSDDKHAPEANTGDGDSTDTNVDADSDADPDAGADSDTDTDTDTGVDTTTDPKNDPDADPGAGIDRHDPDADPASDPHDTALVADDDSIGAER